MTTYLVPTNQTKGSPLWTHETFQGKEDFSYSLEIRECVLLIRALDRILDLYGTDYPFWHLERSVFQDLQLAPFFAQVKAELSIGRGFGVICNLPIQGLSLPEIKALYWIVGSFFGAGQSQSNLGDRLGEVINVTDEDPHARGYRSDRELHLHTDICDIIALLAVRQAQSGGESFLASAAAIHRLFQQERPDLLARLKEGYFYHRRGEHAPDEEPITPHKVPVFSQVGGILSLRYVRPYMEHALKVQGKIDPQLIEAFDQLDRYAEQIKVNFSLEPGEILIFNNLAVLHGRSGFVDWPEREKRRLLLRLWLNDPDFRPQLPTLAVFGTGDGIPYVPGRNSSFEGFEG